MIGIPDTDFLPEKMAVKMEVQMEVQMAVQMQQLEVTAVAIGMLDIYYIINNIRYNIIHYYTI